MNDLDLDRLGDLWRAQPDPKEMQRLRRSAASAARRARWGQVADYLLTALVSTGIVAIVASNPSLNIGLAGAGAILLMLAGTVHQRRLRQIELKALTGTSEEMLDQSIERLTATRKRAAFGMLAAIPSVLLGLGFGAILESDAGELLARWRENREALRLIEAVMVGLLVMFVAHLVIAARRSRAELAHLKALREAYRSEEEAAEERP
jgi:hypothetical protein